MIDVLSLLLATLFRMANDKLIEQLNTRMGIEGAVRFDRGRGGLVRAIMTCGESRESKSTLETPVNRGAVHLYQHGGHVTHFQPAGSRPVLFLSKDSNFESGKPIRGGIPICFPWFAQKLDEPDASMHGLARDRAWKFRSVEKKKDGAVEIMMVLKWNSETLSIWPFKFVLTNTVTLDAAGKMLTVSLGVKHIDTEDGSNPPFTFEAALHSYISIADIAQTGVMGLGGVKYIDKLDHFTTKQQNETCLEVTRETDRVYDDASQTCCVVETDREVVLTKSNSGSTIIWNPWIEKSKQMRDFGDDEWRNMLCVETANVASEAVKLTSRQGHQMNLTIACYAKNKDGK